MWNPASESNEPSDAVIKVADSFSVDSVLDVGCGTGRNLAPFAVSASHVHGFDLDASSIRTARTHFPGAKLWVDDVVSVNCTRSYDFVVCHGVLHFLTKNQRKDVYEKLRNWTKPGGTISVVSFNSRTPIPDDLSCLMVDPPEDSDELLAAFSGWSHLEFESYTYRDAHSGGIEHTHTIDRLVALKYVDKGRSF